MRQRPRPAGPDNDPYSVLALSNRHQVVTDAAGDTVLRWSILPARGAAASGFPPDARGQVVRLHG